MKKTKIDWADSTWNPVTGCLHGCDYCYARKIANRFGRYKRIEDLLCPKEYPKDCGICKACNRILNEPMRSSDTYEYMRQRAMKIRHGADCFTKQFALSGK